MSSLAPIPSEQTVCEHCGAALVADQRYCLSCGQPVSPVRLAFLDVLQSEQTLSPAVLPAAAPPATVVNDIAGPAWLRRYAPIFAVMSVLLLALLAGLLVGHWASQGSGRSGPQVVKIEGLGGIGALTSDTTSTGGSKASKSSSGAAHEEKSTPHEEKSEEAEARKEESEHVAPPPPVKVSAKKINKLEKST